jgi:hypothetical protein
MLGDLVHVTADNYGCGVGMIVEIEDDEEYGSSKWRAFRILLNDGKLLYFFKDELEPVTEEVSETR